MKPVRFFAVALVAAACGNSTAQTSQRSSSEAADPGATTPVHGASQARPEAESSDAGALDNRDRVALVVVREDIVSNLPGAGAQDPDLQNAWGLAFSPRGPAWVSANETGLSGVYDAKGQHVIPSVTIPPPAGGAAPAHPTGQVFNSDASAFHGDVFVFATEDGTISGWQPPGTAATLRVDHSADGAVYKGVTIADDVSGRRIYAANFHSGAVEVYDASYTRVDLPGGFHDDQLPDGFAPFNVKQMNGMLFVAYAKQDADKHDDVAGRGNGFIDVFDTEGALVRRLVAGGVLNSPWGMAIAPRGFGRGEIADRLLIGNFGDGIVRVYRTFLDRPMSIDAQFEGVLGDDKGDAIVIDGLWALEFGLGVGGFSQTDLYFTAGPNGETDGVFGELHANTTTPPPPKAW